MRKCLFLTLACGCLLFFTHVEASNSPLAFSLHKLGKAGTGKTILVVGGIQGDEPGGFHAASLLVTHYNITNGSLWVVPNLNFPSIINRSRGKNGDMNRKFADVAEADPEFETVKRIKSIILNQDVDLVLNLHDGSGFYAENYVDEMRGPHRWGQSVIIDQESIDGPELGQMGDIGRDVIARVNTHMGSQEQHYILKNTRTREGDMEMAKTLTYFAINNAKPAFGIEASKSLNKAERVYCHLAVIEAFMDRVGLKYTRKFPLEVASVEKALADNRQIAFYDNRIYLEMENVRNQLNYFPVYRSKNIDFTSKNPLITIVQSEASFDVYHGNEKLTTLSPAYVEHDDFKPPTMLMVVDGKEVLVTMGQTVAVSGAFKIVPREGYRANIIGFSTKGMKNEAGVLIQQQDCQRKYSVNTKADTFRVEFYKQPSAKNKKNEGVEQDKFAGMVNVQFVSSLAADSSGGRNRKRGTATVVE